MRNLIPHFIQEQYEQEQYAGQFEALTMFVDVSGFTPMTQVLMKQGHEGAEILASILNGMFDLMVDVVYARGGFVSVFAGDAFTAIFPLHQPAIPAEMLALHVLACAEDIHAIFRRYGIQDTAYGQFALQLKIGLSYGVVEWGIIGRAEKTYFFRGQAIDGCAASEHHADKGDIIFDRFVGQLLRKVPHLLLTEIQHLELDRLADGYVRLKKLPETLTQQLTPPDLPALPELQEAVLRHFLPDALIHFTTKGEFRRVAAIFIAFEGITTMAEFNDWAFVLIENIKRFSGYFNHLDFGDKGAVVVCGFGAPVAHENMLDRALNFILSVKEELKTFKTLSNLKFRAGLACGIAFAGIAGGQKRCEYTFYGEVINLAARFMMKAEWGEVYASEAVRNNTVQFNFEHKGDIPYKGFADPVPTYALLSRKSGIRHQAFTETMVGRQAELQQLRQCAAPIFEPRFAGVVCIYGEAGIGKSRLAFAFQEELTQQKHATWFNCPADQILQKPFNPFITCLARYFDQSPELAEKENKKRFKEKYAALVQALNPHPVPPPEGEGEDSPRPVGQGLGARAAVKSELLRTKSVIGAQIGLSWKDSLWEQLDAKGKYNNTLDAIKNFFLAHSLLQPVVIELEDGHWIDSDSSLLLQSLTRNVAPYPLLILSTLRYSDDGGKMRLFDVPDLARQQTPYAEIELREFTEPELRHFVKNHLEGAIAEQVYALLLEQSKGNPFFAEQLLHYFLETALLQCQDGVWQMRADKQSTLPDNINAVLIARIDRLSDEVKDVVKTAAVIGREFDVLLLSEMLQKEVLPQVQTAQRFRIWEALQELLYMFRHALLRDAAYQMQLSARRRELHQLAAETMETLYAGSLAEKYADLAFHYEKARISDKAIEYLQKAADAAKAKYQNQQALGLYDRLLAQVHDVFGFEGITIDALLNKAEILDLIGEWDACQQVCAEALQLAEQIDDKRRMGQAKLLSGIIVTRTGQHDKAMTFFEDARELFEVINEKAGIGRVFRCMGVISWQKSDYDAAIAEYEKSLRLYEEAGDTLNMAITTNNMGVAYDLKSDYDTAMTWYQKSLNIISEELGEKLNKAKVLNNIGENRRLQGHYEAAITYYKQALQLKEELGDKLHIISTLSNMGFISKVQGNYDRALAYFDRGIGLGRELGNKYYLCECVVGKAEVLFLLQEYQEAQTLNTEGLWIAEEIGRKEYILQGKVLSARIEFVLGNKDAPRHLENMLPQTEDQAELAVLHYELWKMTQEDKHRRTAFDLYHALCAAAPNIEYKERMEELQE